MPKVVHPHRQTECGHRVSPAGKQPRRNDRCHAETNKNKEKGFESENRLLVAEQSKQGRDAEPLQSRQESGAVCRRGTQPAFHSAYVHMWKKIISQGRKLTNMSQIIPTLFVGESYKWSFNLIKCSSSFHTHPVCTCLCSTYSVRTPCTTNR